MLPGPGQYINIGGLYIVSIVVASSRPEQQTTVKHRVTCQQNVAYQYLWYLLIKGLYWTHFAPSIMI